MSLRKRLVRAVGFEQLSHRPHLTTRFWIYCVAAYVIPVAFHIGFPEDHGLTDELVWLVTLVPALLLSLHYGLRGALAALLLATVLFLGVQAVTAFGFTPEEWRITVPIYAAYGMLAIGMGWLSEELHGFYHRALTNERMAAIGQLAVTVRHEMNNALTAIVTESQLLMSDDAELTEPQKSSANNIYRAAMRITENIKKITSLLDAPVTTYAGGVKMVDLQSARTREN